MAGYSGTPLRKKLGIRDGHRVHFRNAPEDFDRTLGPLAGVERLTGRAWNLDVILLFETRASRLERAVPGLADRLAEAGALWAAWPKKTSGVATDLGFEVVQGIGLGAGLVDVKVCAIDETWSGLKFVYRVADRPRRAAGKGAR